MIPDCLCSCRMQTVQSLLLADRSHSACWQNQTDRHTVAVAPPPRKRHKADRKKFHNNNRLSCRQNPHHRKGWSHHHLCHRHFHCPMPPHRSHPDHRRKMVLNSSRLSGSLRSVPGLSIHPYRISHLFQPAPLLFLWSVSSLHHPGTSPWQTAGPYPILWHFLRFPLSGWPHCRLASRKYRWALRHPIYPCWPHGALQRTSRSLALPLPWFRFHPPRSW